MCYDLTYWGPDGSFILVTSPTDTRQLHIEHTTRYTILSLKADALTDHTIIGRGSIIGLIRTTASIGLRATRGSHVIIYQVGWIWMGDTRVSADKGSSGHWMTESSDEHAHALGSKEGIQGALG